MTTITIPPEALEKAARDIFRVGFDREPLPHDPFDEDRLAFARKYARAAALALLEAWPGMFMTDNWDGVESIILPLPQESS